MKLSEEVKQKIIDEYNEWFNTIYGNKTKEERSELGAVFTQPNTIFQMLEYYDEFTDADDIIDPTCGSGNLLVACIIAGANPARVYGNEYDAEFVELARKRLAKFGVPTYHIHQGNALNPKAVEIENFTEDYKPIMNAPSKAERKCNKLAKSLFGYSFEEYEQLNLFDDK